MASLISRSDTTETDIKRSERPESYCRFFFLVLLVSKGSDGFTHQQVRHN
jgi:hypothetical protein